MYLYIDLLEKKKISIFYFVLGIISLLFGIVKLFNLSQMGIVDWIVCITYTLLGIYFLFYGFGIPIERFFGKAFIFIDKETFAIKPNIFKKEQCVYWKDVKAVSFKLNKIEIQNVNDENESFNLSNLPFQIKKQIKETIGGIANEENIKTNSI